MTANKQQSCRFVNEVLLLMHSRGWHSATKPGEPKGLNPSERVRGDISGLPVTVAVRSSMSTIDLSGSLREAQREAAAEGHDIFVSVQARRGQPVESSFVLTDLTTWLEILARLHPEARTPTTPLVQAGA